MTDNVSLARPLKSAVLFYSIRHIVSWYLALLLALGKDDHDTSALHVKRLPFLLQSFATGAPFDLHASHTKLTQAELPPLLVVYR